MDAILLSLAEILMKKWKNTPELKGDRANLIPESKFDIITGLRLLAAFNLPLAGVLKNATDAKKIVGDVEAAIKEFQQSFSILHKDGVLGNMTLKMLLDAFSCPGEASRPTTKISNATKKMMDELGGGVWYFYYIDSIPNVPGPVENYSIVLLQNAWTRWKKFAGVNSQLLRPNERHLANVIIKEKILPGRVLGQAHVGNPPSTFILELELDKRPDWTKMTFYNAVCHEIGHVLGLEHSADPTELMFPTIPSDANGPTDSDGARAAGLPWLGPPK